MLWEWSRRADQLPCFASFAPLVQVVPPPPLFFFWFLRIIVMKARRKPGTKILNWDITQKHQHDFSTIQSCLSSFFVIFLPRWLEHHPLYTRFSAPSYLLTHKHAPMRMRKLTHKHYLYTPHYSKVSSAKRLQLKPSSLFLFSNRHLWASKSYTYADEG